MNIYRIRCGIVVAWQDGLCPGWVGIFCCSRRRIETPGHIATRRSEATQHRVFASLPTDLVGNSGALLFRADDETGLKLFQTDGVSASAVLDGGSVTISNPASVTDVAGDLYFVSGNNLWRTAAGSTAVVMTFASPPADLAAVGSSLFFAADSGSGAALWRATGATASPVQSSGSNLGSPSLITRAGPLLYLRASTGTATPGLIADWPAAHGSSPFAPRKGVLSRSERRRWANR